MLPNLIKIHRISHWCYKKHIPIIPSLCRLYAFIIHGSRLPPSVVIGKGTSFTAKGMGIVMHGKEIIGNNCQIGHHVKMLRKSPYIECVKMGDNVFVSSGAVLIGNIIIGDNVIIGANAVVTKSVPENTIVGGIPAKIIGNTNSLGYNIFETTNATMFYIEGYAPFLEK